MPASTIEIRRGSERAALSRSDGRFERMTRKRFGTGAACLILGGTGYGVIEVLWRGYTHFSMLLVGGMCFYLLVFLARREWHWLRTVLTGGLAITAAELLAGCVVNLWLGWAVWDYSLEFGNLWGQICPGFTLIWCGISAVITGGYRLCRRWAAQFARR